MTLLPSGYTVEMRIGYLASFVANLNGIIAFHVRYAHAKSLPEA